jgi:hypothetical protein
MKTKIALPFAVLAALVSCSMIRVAVAQEKPKSDVITIALKDFKFKPPAGVSDPDSVFVFNEDDAKLCFYTNGPAEAKFKVPADGDWDVIVTASGDTATHVPTKNATGKKEMDISPKFQLAFDGKDFGKEVSLKSDDEKDYKFVVPLKAGEHVISVAFTNDTYDPDGKFDSNFYLNGVRLHPLKAGEADKK